jgi:hypothetical protein
MIWPYGLIKSSPFGHKSSDGSEITNVSLGSQFPKGLFVAMSENKGFKYFDWRDIEKEIMVD